MIALAATLLLCGTLSTSAAQTTKTKNTQAAVPAPQDYCTSTGGVVESRYPVYGTNNPTQDWILLQGREGFCQYTQASDGSRIHVSLATLFHHQAQSGRAGVLRGKLRGTARGNGNPASFYCTQLGGSDSFGGVSAAAALVELDTIDVVLEAASFPITPPSIRGTVFTIPTALFAASISPPF